MKTCTCLIVRRRLGLLFLLLAADICLGSLAHAAAGFSVSPSTISGAYSGSINLQITGLTNGESVLIERFLDVNTNSTIDSGDLLVQSVPVTDGQVTSFGGVRDLNVPGDDDGTTNGQIATRIFFATSAEFGRVTGPHLLRLSSPGGHFTAVVQPLNVTEAATGQRITGQITSGGSGVPYASVALLVMNGEDVEFITGAVANATGNFSLSGAPGTYLVLPARTGFVSDLTTSPLVTLNPGQVITQNLSLIQPTRTISGRITDLATGNGIAGLQLFIESTAGNRITFGFTDAAGNFT